MAAAWQRPSQRHDLPTPPHTRTANATQANRTSIRNDDGGADTELPDRRKLNSCVDRCNLADRVADQTQWKKERKNQRE